MTPFLLGQTAPTSEPALVWPWAANWQTPISERLEWRTATAGTQSGKEQRRALRRWPRLYFGFSSNVTHAEVPRLLEALSSWRTGTWAVPAWWATAKLTASATDVLALDRATETLWPDSGWALLWRSATDCEPVEVVTVGSTTLTLAAEPAGSWPAGSIVVPLYFAVLGDTQNVSAPAAAVATIATQWVADPLHGNATPEGGNWPLVFPADADTSDPRKALWSGQHNWAEQVTLEVSQPLDIFDPGSGGWSRRAAADLPAQQWSQRVLLVGDDQQAALRRFAGAHRGAAVGFYAVSPLTDVTVTDVTGSDVTFATPIADASERYAGLLLDGVAYEVETWTSTGATLTSAPPGGIDFQMQGDSLVDETGKHTISGSGVASFGGWITFTPVVSASISPAINSAPNEPWSIQFRSDIGGILRLLKYENYCTLLGISAANGLNTLFSLSSRNISDYDAVSANVGAGELVTVDYQGGIVTISSDGGVLASTYVGVFLLAFDQFGNWNAQYSFDGSVQSLTVTRAALDPSKARLIAPARLASDALEITHHTRDVAEASLSIHTTPLPTPSADATVKLLLHFDGDVVDAVSGNALTVGAATYGTGVFGQAASHSGVPGLVAPWTAGFTLSGLPWALEFRAKIPAGGTMIVLSKNYWPSEPSSGTYARDFTFSVSHAYDTGVTWGPGGTGSTAGDYLTLPDDEWFAMAMTDDLITFRIYLDGAVVYSHPSVSASLPAGGGQIAVFNELQGFSGSTPRWGGGPSNGQLDELRLVIGRAVRTTSTYSLDTSPWTYP